MAGNSDTSQWDEGKFTTDAWRDVGKRKKDDRAMTKEEALEMLEAAVVAARAAGIRAEWTWADYQLFLRYFDVEAVRDEKGGVKLKAVAE